MNVARYIKTWGFQPQDGWTLSDASKITAQGSYVRLKIVKRAVPLPGRPSSAYPTDLNIFVRTASFAPTAKRSWDFVEVVHTIPLDENGDPTGSVTYRVFDGTDALYWDGAAWSVATLDAHWNDISEVNTNLSAYTGSSIAFDVRLVTTDDRFTPVINCVKLRWTGVPVNSYDEFIYRVVIPELQDGLRPQFAFDTASNGTTTYNISTIVAAFDAAFDVQDVLAAYDHTTDPNHTTDLLSSYVAPTATLTSSVPAGRNVVFVATYKPDVAVTTSSVYVLDAVVPAVWITAITPRGAQHKFGGAGPHVIDVTQSPPQGTVFVENPPTDSLDFAVALVTPDGVGITELAGAFAAWLDSRPTLRSPALDERVTLWSGSALDWLTANADFDDTRLSTASFSLLDIPLYLFGAEGGNKSVGAVDAGDPNNPGVGYGVEQIVINWHPTPGADEQTTIPGG